MGRTVDTCPHCDEVMMFSDVTGYNKHVRDCLDKKVKAHLEEEYAKVTVTVTGRVVSESTLIATLAQRCGVQPFGETHHPGPPLVDRQAA